MYKAALRKRDSWNQTCHSSHRVTVTTNAATSPSESVRAARALAALRSSQLEEARLEGVEKMRDAVTLNLTAFADFHVLGTLTTARKRILIASAKPKRCWPSAPLLCKACPRCPPL